MSERPVRLVEIFWCPYTLKGATGTILFLVLTYLLTYLLTRRCRVLHDKLIGLQLVKKFPAFHGSRRFITALTSVRHLSLSWASPIQSIYPHRTSWRYILILSTHLRLGLPSGLFPSGFPAKLLNLQKPLRAKYQFIIIIIIIIIVIIVMIVVIIIIVIMKTCKKGETRSTGRLDTTAEPVG